MFVSEDFVNIYTKKYGMPCQDTAIHDASCCLLDFLTDEVVLLH